MNTKDLPFWIRHTNNCPLRKFLGEDCVKMTANEYFMLLHALLPTSKRLRTLTEHAMRWAVRESEARARFKKILKSAPATVSYGIPPDAYQDVHARSAFYERLQDYKPSQPEGFGTDNARRASHGCRLPRKGSNPEPQPCKPVPAAYRFDRSVLKQEA